jgi:hypothetical protein
MNNLEYLNNTLLPKKDKKTPKASLKQIFVNYKK